jgi:hypothetical protein
MTTTTIIVNIGRGLVKTHDEFIKKCFLWLEYFFVKAKINYDKGDYDWTIELSTTTKVTTILTFDLLVKLHFLRKDTICSFSRCMIQPFVTTTICFIVNGVHGEIDSKFELLVANKSDPKDIQIVSLKIKIFLKHCFWFLPT